MKKSIMAILILVVIAAVPVFAARTYYFTGDQVFSIRAGVDFPAFISFPNDSDRNTVAFSETHLKLGGVASIAYQGYISPYFALGGELGYVFNYSRSKLLLTTVPFSAKLTFVPVQTGRFDLAMHMNLGGAFIRYNEGKYFAPFASLTVNPVFYITENWGIGVESGLMATAELYGKNNSKYKSTAFCGLLPISVTLSYRH